MTILTSEEDRCRIRKAAEVLKEVFDKIGAMVHEGVSTMDLDQEAERIIYKRGAEPAFKGYKGFPASICTSVNEVVVHGIPSHEDVLVEGDIVGIDIGVKKNSYFVDSARTFAVGKISGLAAHLIATARQCLTEGVKQAVKGNRVCDISSAIETLAQQEGFEEVRMFVGHGIGKGLHEFPEVPNWGRKGTGLVLNEGLVLAIEPMINAGSRDVKVLEDGWTVVTIDSELSAHFEDTIIVGAGGTEVLT